MCKECLLKRLEALLAYDGAAGSKTFDFNSSRYRLNFVEYIRSAFRYESGSGFGDGTPDILQYYQLNMTLLSWPAWLVTRVFKSAKLKLTFFIHNIWRYSSTDKWPG